MAYLIFQCFIDSVNLTSTSSRLRSRFRSIFVLAPFSYIRFVLISYLLASIHSISCLCPLETEIQGWLYGHNGNFRALHRHLSQTFILGKESFSVGWIILKFTWTRHLKWMNGYTQGTEPWRTPSPAYFARIDFWRFKTGPWPAVTDSEGCRM